MKDILKVLITSLLSAILAVWIYACFFAPEPTIIEQPSNLGRPAAFADNSTAEKYIVATPDDFTEAAGKVTSAVVHIKSLTKSYDWWGGPSYASSSGSGVLISDDGYIVTNNHVIEDATDLEVTMNDRTTYEARLIGSDPTTDLALIKIQPRGKTPSLKFSDSDKARIGQWVLAVGNPFSLKSTVTAGIISAKGRDIEILEDSYAIESFIQTDAAVNPGNSGGALVNTNGDLVGINTAIITKSGRYEGYSFAVPSNLVEKVVSDIKEFGRVQRGLLNVIVEEVNQTKMDELGLPSLDGLYIKAVNIGGAAEDAGLLPGDVIVAINDKKVGSMPQLQEILGVYRPGDKLTLQYYRNRKRQSVEITLKDRFHSTLLNSNRNSVNREMADLGFELRNLSKDESNEMNTQGVKVISIFRNSKIDATNMEPGYIITKLNDKNIASVEDLIKTYKSIQPGTKIMLEGFYAAYPDEYFYAFRK